MCSRQCPSAFHRIVAASAWLAAAPDLARVRGLATDDVMAVRLSLDAAVRPATVSNVVAGFDAGVGATVFDLSSMQVRCHACIRLKSGTLPYPATCVRSCTASGPAVLNSAPCNRMQPQMTLVCSALMRAHACTIWMQMCHDVRLAHQGLNPGTTLACRARVCACLHRPD